ncbi:hypothetical protein ACWEJ7_05770 [Streptomyces albidoflavus]
MLSVRLSRAGLGSVVLTAVLCAAAPTASAIGGVGDDKDPVPPSGASGGSSGPMLTAEATATSIRITRTGGGGPGGADRPPTPVDPAWRPPACWYEPVATPEELRAGVDRLKADGGPVRVTPTLSWGRELMVNHYEKGEAQHDGPGYEDYNLGKDGRFWRGVINESRRDELDIFDCERNLFWQAAGTVPEDAHAPTPEVLASYAYDKIRLPGTEVELKPAARSTVNLPTWVWLDKAAFQEVTVRAELPHTGLWAETTARPVSLHVEPGTPDAVRHPASGECTLGDDGSIGTPYVRGGGAAPPCGITYLRASGDAPYTLTASLTWEISWKGSGGAQGDLPDGAFETTQEMVVREIQAVNR